MVAYLKSDAVAFGANFESAPHSTQWGAKEVQHMLAALPWGGRPYLSRKPSTGTDSDVRTAMSSFRRENGIEAATGSDNNGLFDRTSREALIKLYLEIEGTTLPATVSIASIGCGARHLQEKTDRASAKNRHVEVLAFERSPFLPSQADYEQAQDKDEIYKKWLAVSEEHFPEPPADEQQSNIKPEPTEFPPLGYVKGAFERLQQARQAMDGGDREGALKALQTLSDWISPLGENGHLQAVFGKLPLQAQVLTAPVRVAEQTITDARGRLESMIREIRIGTKPKGLWNDLEARVRAARFYLEASAGEGVSFELQGAPPYEPSLELPEVKGSSRSQIRVFHWLSQRRELFASCEKRFRIDRRAIAGAIAWEATENILSFSARAIGPGKIHVRHSSQYPLLVEKEVLPLAERPKDEAQREERLKTAEWSIIYIYWSGNVWGCKDRERARGPRHCG